MQPKEEGRVGAVWKSGYSIVGPRVALYLKIVSVMGLLWVRGQLS
jgi:hypothetical protein